ncbi:MAG: hypothetical protein AAF821_08120 [Cyanobacteria bacterium P01_D01_bin.156]
MIPILPICVFAFIFVLWTQTALANPPKPPSPKEELVDAVIKLLEQQTEKKS